MKISTNNPKRRLTGIVAVCLLSLLFSACLKNDPNVTPAKSISYLSTTLASVDAPLSNFYIDGTEVNTTGISYGSGISYITAYSGTRVVAFKNGSGTQFASDTLTLAPNAAYSLYLSNSISHPDFIVLKDTINFPSASLSNIRFVNVSSDSPAVDFAITGGSVLAANKSYKGFSPFVSVQGNIYYDFEVRKAGTTTVLATLKNISLNGGSVYTVSLLGSTASTNSATNLSLSVFNNASEN